MKYKFEAIKDATIQRGYTQIIIINHECIATTDEQKQLAIDNGGVEIITSNRKTKKLKAVKE